MIDLSRFLVNQFYPLETSETNFVEGVDRHIGLFEAADPVTYAPEIAATKAQRTVMMNALSARNTETSQRMASTQAMNEAKDDFVRFMRVSEGLIKYTFQGDTSSQYLDFFPEGLREINEATLVEIEIIMNRIVNKATDYQVQLGAPFLNDCIAKRQAFIDARGAQVVNIGETTLLQKGAQSAIQQMGVQMCFNLLTIARNNIGNPAIIDSYFDQHYFQRPEVSGLYTGTNAADQVKTVRSQGWTNEKNIEIINKGTEAFIIGFANAEGSWVPDLPTNQLIPPGETRTFTAQQMGYAVGNAYLNIKAGEAGAIWEVRVTD